MTAFEASPHSSLAPPSCAIQPKEFAATENYHVILTAYIPANITARRMEGNTRKEAGRKALTARGRSGMVRSMNFPWSKYSCKYRERNANIPSTCCQTLYF